MRKVAKFKGGCISRDTTFNNALKDKRVNCLKCDKEFNGRKNLRICSRCKETDIYKCHPNTHLCVRDMVK